MIIHYCSSLTEEEVLEVIELVDTEVIPRAISLKVTMRKYWMRTNSNRL